MQPRQCHTRRNRRVIRAGLLERVLTGLSLSSEPFCGSVVSCAFGGQAAAATAGLKGGGKSPPASISFGWSFQKRICTRSASVLMQAWVTYFCTLIGMWWAFKRKLHLIITPAIPWEKPNLFLTLLEAYGDSSSSKHHSVKCSLACHLLILHTVPSW